jgi:glycosyltransferase involved in cell wall biosynthesis
VTSPRLLFISPRFLFPLDQGGKIRTTGVLRAMQGGTFEIVLVSPAPPEADRYAPDLATVCDRFAGWPEPRSGTIGRTLALAGSLPVSAASDRSSLGAAIVANELAARPDVVVVDFPHAAVLLPDRIGVPSVIFTHNVEAEIFERHAEVANGIWQPVWQREAAKMRAFEQITLRRFDTVVAVSERDGRVLRERFGLANIETIDTGVDLEFYAFHPPAGTARTVVFAGAMDSRSNIDGIEFLMDEVWPLVAAARPDARMAVVGRNPPPALIAKAERKALPWQFTGFVDDIRPAVLAGDVSVIPLRVGSGTRLKAFEAMALGRPVVSTTLGVEGLAVEPGEHCLVADTAEGFANAVVKLLSDAGLRGRLAGASRGLLEARFSWASVGRQFEAICQRTITRRAAPAT